ncbi:hypothetical protein V6N13_039485 [Hibiscus sabdariffa]
MNIKLLCWNVQGCGHPKFLNTVRQYLYDYKPDLVVFVEPRVSGFRADTIIASLGFPYSHRVEAQGFSGGIWLAWFESITVDIILNHFQFFHCRVTDKRNGNSALASIICASPNATKRKALWSHLRHLASSINSPWILFGDFNATLCSSERMGGSSSTKPSRCFQEFVYDVGLRDMGFIGPDYTRKRGLTQARLDRFLCNSYWDESFPDSSVHHILRMKSDHRPICLYVGESVKNYITPPFRYLSSWSAHSDFNRMVEDNWLPAANFSETIISFTKAANMWNKTVYGYIGTKTRLVMARLRGVQKALCAKSSRFLSTLESDLLKELENILDQEKLIWRQKSRIDWVVLGDRNTRYFHCKAVCRKQRNRINALKLPSGEWCSNPTTLRAVAAQFFQTLFTVDDIPDGCLPVKGKFPHLPQEAVSSLDVIPSEQESMRLLWPWPLSSHPDGMLVHGYL